LIKEVKGVKFGYKPTHQTRELLTAFRNMVNDTIRISLTEDIHGRLKLRDRLYKEFQDRYDVVSCFPYSVAEVAWSILKKHRRWRRMPYAKRLMMKMDSRRYTLIHSILSLPFRKGERILIPLRYGDYQRGFLMDDAPKRGSVTVTDTAGSRREKERVRQILHRTAKEIVEKAKEMKQAIVPERLKGIGTPTRGEIGSRGLGGAG